MTMKTTNLLFTGVGGQGTILMTKLLSAALVEAGYDVKMSEIHGMSQRGGAVSSHVRYGSRVHSPVIELGGADIVVSFEQLEALRWLEYLKPDGKIIINDYRINPISVVSARASYPAGILDELSSKAATTVVNAGGEAVKLGNARVMNIILLGATIQLMELGDIDWDKIISENVKPAFAELNVKALSRGRELVRNPA
jgi:indolepyruvate ferredoxin oxidoreductase beta subunit